MSSSGRTARPTHTPPSGRALALSRHPLHTPTEERTAAGFWPDTCPSDEQYSESDDDHPPLDSLGPKMEIDTKPQTSYEVDASDGQTFAGKAGTLPAFLTHVKLKELLDSDLGDTRIKCAYTANQLRGVAREWFVRTLPSKPQLLQQWSALEGALVSTFSESDAIRRQRDEYTLTHLKQTTTVGQLVAQLEGLCDMLGWLEPAKKGLFVNALKEPIRREVLQFPDSGYMEVKEIAQRVEAANSLFQSAGNAGRRTRRSRKSGKPKCHRFPLP